MESQTKSRNGIHKLNKYLIREIFNFIDNLTKLKIIKHSKLFQYYNSVNSCNYRVFTLSNHFESKNKNPQFSELYKHLIDSISNFTENKIRIALFYYLEYKYQRDEKTQFILKLSDLFDSNIL